MKQAITDEKFKNYWLEYYINKSWKKPWGLEKSQTSAISRIDGYKNTVQMYLHGNELSKWTLDLNIDGKDDWYLPAIEELSHIMIHGMELFSDESRYVWYWSSTESAASEVFVLNYETGEVQSANKELSISVCICRRVYSKDK